MSVEAPKPEAEVTIPTPDRTNVQNAPAEDLLAEDEKQSLSELTGVKGAETVMLDVTKFSGVFKQIKEINSKVEECKRIAITIENNKFNLKWADKSAEVDLAEDGFEEKLLETIQNVLGEYKDAIPESNQYTELAESLKDAKDPVSAMCRVFAMWASKFPGLADMLFFGGFYEKVKSGNHLKETFSEPEKDTLKAAKKVLTQETRDALARSVERNLDPTHASFSYLAKVLWPAGEIIYKSPAGFAAQLRSAGENGKSDSGLVSEFHHFYTEYADNNLGDFKPVDGAIVFFSYGDNAKLPGGLGKVIAITSALSADSNDQQKAPSFFMGHIIDGKLEYYNAEEGKVIRIEISDPKLDISLAYSPTEYLIKEQRPQEDKDKELQKIELKKTMDEKAALVFKLEEDLKKLEDNLKEIKDMDALAQEINGGSTSTGVFEKAALDLKRKDFESLQAKHPDYIRASDKVKFIAELVANIGKAVEELEAAKKAALEAKEAYESATSI